MKINYDELSKILENKEVINCCERCIESIRNLKYLTNDEYEEKVKHALFIIETIKYEKTDTLKDDICSLFE